MASVIGFGPVGSKIGKVRGRTSAPDRSEFSGVDRLIQSEVIPRLLVAHSSYEPSAPVGNDDISAAEIARFAPLAVTLEAHELLGEVEHFMRRGIGVEQIFVELLAPAARFLGDEWKADNLDFVDVTMGLWRLQEVLREIAARTPPIMHIVGQPRAALFAPMPGEQHSFGTAIVEQCFSRAGWNTDLVLESSRSELIGRVANKRFDLVGLTISCDSHIAALPSLITAVRNVSRNPRLCLMIGGCAVAERPALVEEVGADGTAATALGALEMADRFVMAPLRMATA